MRSQRKPEKQGIKTEVIPVTVKPATVAKLREDVTTLEKDAVDKQIVIDQLQADVASQKSRIDVLEAGDITP